MIDPQIVAFTLAALVVTISPGPDTFLVIGNTARGGVRTGLATVAGISSGAVFHAALFGLGFAQLLAWSPRLFMAVKLCGAAYLIYLGVGALRSAWRGGSTRPAVEAAPPPDGLSAWASWTQGLLTNALNPKVALFYLAFLPQFMSPADPIAVKSMLLIGIHCLLGALWLGSLVLAIARLGNWLRRTRVRRALDAAVGTLMTGFGLKLALAKAQG